MNRKKYEIYIVSTEFGEEETTIYQEAFAAYQRIDGSATLYGISQMGEMSVILSK